MNKYFLVKPSEFWRYDSVDLEGRFSHVQIDDFDIDPSFNYLIFEVPYKLDYSGKVILNNTATELFTGEKFIVSSAVIPKENEKRDLTPGLRFISEDLGLYSKKLKQNEISCSPSKVSGLMSCFKEDEELLSLYSSYLNGTFDAGRYYKNLHDEAINGPSKSTKREMRRLFKKSR